MLKAVAPMVVLPIPISPRSILTTSVPARVISWNQDLRMLSLWIKKKQHLIFSFIFWWGKFKTFEILFLLFLGCSCFTEIA